MRGPFWTPITPLTGSLLHADPQSRPPSAPVCRASALLVNRRPNSALIFGAALTQDISVFGYCWSWIAERQSAAERLAMRQELSAPLIAELHTWLTTQLARLSRNHDLAKAINYMLRRWDAFTRFLDDGRVCITNNAAK